MSRANNLRNNPRMQAALAQELQKLYTERKGLNPRDVLQWARKHPESALHKFIEWDDAKAGEAYRLDQVRAIIVSVRVVEPTLQKPVQAFVSIKEHRGGRGYIDYKEAVTDKDMATSLLATAVFDMQHFIDKYETLAELVDVLAVMKGTVEKLSTKLRKKQADTKEAIREKSRGHDPSLGM